jgi:hypothetical protein
MPAPTNVKVTFTGDTSQLSAAAATANKALVSTGAAADTADKKMRALNDEAGRVGDSMGKAGGSAAKAAGALSMLSPGAAGAAGSLADLADVGELAAEAAAALGVSATAAAFALGAVLSAVALLSAAYVGWNEEAATATRLTEQQNALTAATAPLYADTEAAIRGAKVELGLMTDAQSAMIDAGISGLAQYQAATEATRKRLSDLRTEQASITGQLSSLVGDIGEAMPLQEFNMMAQIIDGLTNSTDEFNMEEGALQEGLTRTSDALRDNRVAHQNLSEAKEEGAAATEKFTGMEKAAESAAYARVVAEQELQAVLEARAVAEQEYADGVASLRDIEREANSDRLTEMEALDQARADQVAALNASLTGQLAEVEGNELKQAEIEQAGQDARLALEQRYQRDKGAIIEEGNDAVAQEIAQAGASDLAALEATHAAQFDMAQAGAQALVDITSSIYTAMSEAGLKKGLKASFIASKVAALAQAGLNTAFAVSNALATPLPPPFPQIAAVAAGISGAVAMAVIAAKQPPSFRSGYMPDQQLAMIEPQSELVAPASAVQALGGMDAARGAFAGVSPVGQSVTRFYIGHKGFSAMTSDSAGRPGPLRDLTVRPSGRVNPYTRNTG